MSFKGAVKRSIGNTCCGLELEVAAATVGCEIIGNGGRRDKLKHDPEKCAAVFRKIMLNQAAKAR
jgi:hypothetical protein